MSPTLTWLDSFEHQVASSQYYGTNAGLYDSANRTSGMSYVTGRRGGTSHALQIVEDGTTASRVSKAVAAGNQVLVESFYIKIDALPSVDSHFWCGIAGINATVGMKQTTGNIYYSSGSGTQKLITGNWADGQWHRIDLKWVTSGTTYTLDISIDGTAQTQHVSNTTTAADIATAHLGSTAGAHTLTVQFADWVRSVTSGDYPIGPHQVLSLVPNADGTHNWAGSNMGPASGGVASSVSTLWQSVDEFPPNTSDYIQYANATPTATEYAEITLPNTSGTIWGARAVAALFSAATAANAATTRVVDGSGTTVLDLYVGDQSDTSLRYQAGMVPGITTASALNALKYRVGFPTDSSPAPQWSALMIDYAIPGDSGALFKSVDAILSMSVGLTPVLQPGGGGGGGGGLSFTGSGKSMDDTAAPTDDGSGHFYYETSGSWSLPDQALVVAFLVTRDSNSLTAYDSPLTVKHGSLSLTRVSSACIGTNSDTQLETWIGFNRSGLPINGTTRATYPTTKIGGTVHAGYYTGFVDTPSNVLRFVVGYASSGHGTVQTIAMDAPQDPANRTWAGWAHRANEPITYNGTGTVMGGGNYATPATGTVSVADNSGSFNRNPQAQWATVATGVSAALEIRVNQNNTGPSWGPGTPNYQFRSGSPWERPLGSSPTVHASNTTYLKELDGQVFGAGAGATSVADDHPYANGTTTDGALAADLDGNSATTTMTVTAGTVTAFTAAGLSPPFSVLLDLTTNQEHMTVRSWGGSGNTVWTIKRTHPLDAVAHPTGTRVRTGKAFLHFVGGAGNSDEFSTFDTPIYRITDTSVGLSLVHPKTQAPDYGTGWTGSAGSINRRFLPVSDGGDGIGARIPAIAKTYFNAENPSGVSSDAPMILIDTTSGANFIAWFSEMHYYPSVNKWYAQGASIYYYDSYGVDGRNQVLGTVPPADWPTVLNGTGIAPTAYQDQPQNGGNDGHRGVNSQAAVIDWDRMWADGGVFQANGCFMERTNDAGDIHYFPLTGSEHTKGGIIREGTRFHIKNSVTDAAIDSRIAGAGITGNHAQELRAVVKMLRDYGLFASDNSGSGCNTKLQNTAREGRGNLWSLSEDDMQIFPFIDDWEFIQENYDPPISAPSIPTKTIAVSTPLSVGITAIPSTTPPVGTAPVVDYRLKLAQRSASGLGSSVVNDCLSLGVPMDTDFVVKWGRTLNSAGTCEFSLPIDACNPSDFAPGQRELYIYRDSGAGEVLVWGGHLWVADVQYPFVRFLGIGFYEALRHREMGDDFYQFGVDSRSVAWNLIDYTQNLPNGGLGITHGSDAGAGVARTVEACAEERKKITDMIEDLSGADNGFDFEILPNKTWRTWSPLRGTDRTGSVHLDATSNIVDLSYTIDATTVENEVAGIGKAEDGNCEPITYSVVSDGTSQALYGLMQASVNRSDIRQDSDLIRGLAQEELALQKNARKQPTLKLFQGLNGPSPLNFDYDLGDTILVSASRGYATFSNPFRLLAYSVTVDQGGNEFLEVTLDAVAS